jgi:F-type H+-transporting ATPase subunit c
MLPMLAQMTGNLHIAAACLGAAIGVGIIGMKASEAVGRNPGASTKILVQAILSTPSLKASCSSRSSWPGANRNNFMAGGRRRPPAMASQRGKLLCLLIPWWQPRQPANRAA